MFCVSKASNIFGIVTVVYRTSTKEKLAKSRYMGLCRRLSIRTSVMIRTCAPKVRMYMIEKREKRKISMFLMVSKPTMMKI